MMPGAAVIRVGRPDADPDRHAGTGFRRLRRDRAHANGEGCGHCRGTGYKGRRAVAELLKLDDGLRDLIAARAPMSAIKQAARERGMQSLHAVALAAVRAGVTSFEEMDRVVTDA